MPRNCTVKRLDFIGVDLIFSRVDVQNEKLDQVRRLYHRANLAFIDFVASASDFFLLNISASHVKSPSSLYLFYKPSIVPLWQTNNLIRLVKKAASKHHQRHLRAPVP